MKKTFGDIDACVHRDTASFSYFFQISFSEWRINKCNRRERFRKWFVILVFISCWFFIH